MKNNNNLEVIEVKLDGLKKSIDQLHEDLKNLTKVVIANDKSVDLINQRLTGHEKDIDGLGARVSKVETGLQRNWIEDIKRSGSAGLGGGTVAFGLLELIKKFLFN